MLPLGIIALFWRPRKAEFVILFNGFVKGVDL
jgi:hypothetical protein